MKRAEDLRIAAAFDRIDTSRHHLAEGCASLGEFGERLGFSASESRMLARAGRAVRLRPSLRHLLLKGRVSLEGASVLARVLEDPLVAAAFPLRQWIYFAKTESARSLRIRVKRRLEEIRTGGAVHEERLPRTRHRSGHVDHVQRGRRPVPVLRQRAHGRRSGHRTLRAPAVEPGRNPLTTR